MKKIFPILFFLSTMFANAQDSLNMNLLFHWDDSTVFESQKWGNMWQQYNEIWGYTDPQNNREYAIIGAAAGTYIFDVSDPANAFMADFEPGKDTAIIHRDFKTYKNYLYGVADEGAASLQIFDLSYLPDSVHKVYDSDNFVIRSHNIFIDTANGRLYICTPVIAFSSSSLRIMDIATDPENPILLGDLHLQSGQGTHVHDLFVRDGLAYCSNGFDGLFIFDVSDPTNITLKTSITSYPDQDYNHSSWLSEDSKTLFFVDEKAGMGIKAFDISNLNNIEQRSLFRSNPGSMPHNVFVKDYKLYVSYYHDGVWVFDVSNPANPSVIAYYDTYVETNGYDSYQGCWGVYPYLKSGNVLASDFSNGLFVLSDSSKTNIAFGTKDDMDIHSEDSRIFPNPVRSSATVAIPEDIKLDRITVYDVVGKTVYTESFDQPWSIVQLDLKELAPASYYLKIEGREKSKTIKFVKK